MQTPNPGQRLAFRRLSRDGWVNLAVAALLLFYAAQVAFDIAWGNVFGNLGVDFASFWSAGHIANAYGYSAVYDIQLIGRVQRELLPERAAAISSLGVIPTPYLPIFLLPFQLLALVPPVPALAGWIVLNLAGSILYLRTFASRLGAQPLGRRPLVLALVSAPVFLNLFSGQVNLWLMVCTGEFLLAALSGARFRAGLWLAGLLLKPQALVLIVPAVLIQRWIKTALGMLIGGIAILGGSWLLAGTDAHLRLVELWLGYTGGLPTNDPQLMMNWRMIGFHLEGILGPTWATTLVVIGMLVTALAALVICALHLGVDRERTAMALLGLFAATALVAWHAHVHMAMLLIPPLLVVVHQQQRYADSVFRWWILFPAGLYVLRIILAAIMRLGAVGGAAYSLLDLLAGIGLFSMNLILLGWVIDRSRRRQSTQEQDRLAAGRA